jgi:hypothetical protein
MEDKLKKSRPAITLFLFVIFLVFAGSVLAALDATAPGSTFRQGDSTLKGGTSLVTLDAGSLNALNEVAACRQILVNPQLDVIETGPGTGTAEPWFFLEPVIYYFEEGDGSNLAYDGYSLLLPDGDAGDPSPNSDILSQIVTFDKDLNSVTVAYQRAMIDSNPTDKVYGELWLLTPEGSIDLDNPNQYRVTRWQVSDSEGTWAKEEVDIDEGLLDDLSGQEIALLLRTETDGGGATEADMEWVLFDDVTITTCIGEALVYLPVVMRP